MNIKQKVLGDGHIVAGRDIILKEGRSLSDKISDIYNELLRPFFKAMDNKISDLFPDGLVSPTAQEVVKKFSSEELFTSLTLIGIPINVALYVIENIEDELTKLINGQRHLSTDDIRRAVANSLYSYDASEYSTKKKQFWGDKYVRRYGKPSQPILVVNKNGNYDDLDYKFMKEKLLPHLMECIWGIEKFEHYKDYVSQDDQDDMMQEILAAVKSLGIYRIHYSSLLYLAKELALQPPHPWFVEKAFDYDAIKYDLEKAKLHKKNMEEQFNKGDFDTCLYAFRETIHHSSSAILAYYGIYMGCGYLSPLHTLQRVLANIENNQRLEITSKGTPNLKGDLRSIGISINDFSRNIKLLREQLQINSIGGRLDRNEIKIAIDLAAQLFNHCERLLSGFLNIQKLVYSDKTVHSFQALKEIVSDIFHVLPGFEIHSDKKSRTWIIHNLHTPIFKDIKNRILLAPIYVESSRVTPSYLENWTKIINPAISNTIFFVTNSIFSEFCIEFCESLRKKGVLGFTFQLKELIDAAISSDPSSALEMLLIECD